MGHAVVGLEGLLEPGGLGPGGDPAGLDGIDDLRDLFGSDHGPGEGQEGVSRRE